MPRVSAWSGTLETKDWIGGCRPGWTYSVTAVSVGPGRSLADAVSGPPDQQVTRDAEVEGEANVVCGSPRPGFHQR
jgi:hypothetical protein